MFTELTDRVVWYDGDITVFDNNIEALIASGVKTTYIKVTEITPKIEQFNKYTGKTNRITVKEQVRDLDLTWKIPEYYINLDIEQYLLSKLDTYELSDLERNLRVNRVREELKQYHDLSMMMQLRASIYIIETFTEKNIVWGVGRGSSVSSYVLYLIGVHDIDSYKYDLKLSDFISDS